MIDPVSKITLHGAPARFENTLNSVAVDPQKLAVETLNDGLVMPLAPASKDREGLYHGGVYRDDGSFVEISATKRGDKAVISTYPLERITNIQAAKTSGTAVFCGLLSHHFGHFLTESMARLWWGIREGFKGKYLFQLRDNYKISQTALDVFDMLGISGQIEIITAPQCFEHLVIPEAAFAIDRKIHRDFFIPFDKIRTEIFAAKRPKAEQKVFLSRRNLQKRCFVAQDTIESFFAVNGYTIISPEKYSFKQQIEMVIDANELAGIIGSAFHLLLFAGPKNIQYIMRDTPITSNYFMIDTAKGSNSDYFFAHHRLGKLYLGLQTPTLPDLEKLVDMLGKFGLQMPHSKTLPNPELLRREYLSQWNYAFSEKLGAIAKSDDYLVPSLIAHILSPNGCVGTKEIAQRLFECGYASEAEAILAVSLAKAGCIGNNDS